MKLHFRHMPGPGMPVVVLHGLFGSSKNWLSHGKDLSSDFDVYLVDHRNHGDSPWSDDHSLKEMIADALEFHAKEIGRPALWLGHSMGGLVAMGVGLLKPGSVAGLLIADIAPQPYAPHHQREFAALHLNVTHMRTRQEVDGAMAVIHPEASVRQFLQMNLEREGDGFRWKINVQALERADYLNEFESFEGFTYNGPALFLSGRNSSYIRPEDHRTILEYFPQAKIHTIDGDHWLHHTNYAGFMEEVRRFAESL